MLTTRQTLVISLALIESFVLSAHYAVFMPFYPNVALKKGNTSTQVGAFFAVASLIGMLCSPLVGYLLAHGVAPKKLVIFGLTLSGITLATHGFYKDAVRASSDFFIVNVATRIVHSIGPVAATTAIYPIVAVEMGDKRATYIPLIESAYNIGLMIWPSIGAIMYDHFGYLVPFVSVGTAAIFVGILLFIFMPDTPTQDHGKDSVGYRKLDITLLIYLLNIMICYVIIGFNDITLSVQLKRYGLTHSQIGYCFAVATVCYGVCIYLWGFACKSRTPRAIANMCGYLLTATGLVLMGPVEYSGLELSLLVRLIGQGVMGIGLAALFTCSMVGGMHHLTETLQLPDDVGTHGFFSGLLFFALCLGYLVGHAGFAGIILETIGYKLSLLAIVSTLLVLVALDLLNTASKRCTKEYNYVENPRISAN